MLTPLMINVLEEDGPKSQPQRDMHRFTITSLLEIANLCPFEFKGVVSCIGPKFRTTFEVCLKEYMSQTKQAAGKRNSITSAKIKLANF
jgi:hypothetical protein